MKRLKAFLKEGKKLNEGSSDKVHFDNFDKWVKHHKDIGHEITADRTPEGKLLGRWSAHDPYVQEGADNYGISGHWLSHMPTGWKDQGRVDLTKPTKPHNRGWSNYTEGGHYMHQG